MDKIKHRSVSPKIVNFTNVSAEILGPNPRRVGIIFGSTPGGSYSMSWNSPVVIDKGTYNMPASAAYIESLCCCEYGTALQGPIFGIGSGAFTTEFTEILSDETLE